jgi:hypothetical protein
MPDPLGHGQEGALVMAVEGSGEGTKNKLRPVKSIHIMTALLVSLLALAYTIGVLAGFIPESHKIDAIGLAIIALAIVVVTMLVRPDVLERLKLLELTGFRLEMLERVKERQERQENQLEDISLILPLLFPATERKHILNLDQRNTTGYRGHGMLRAELRRLRSITLIEMRNNRHVGDMRDGLTFDLADYVKLTPLGERWAKRIKEIEQVVLPDED